jgi:hypothetical protein
MPAPPARLTFACEDLVFAITSDDEGIDRVLATQLAGFAPSDATPAIVYDIRRPTDDRREHLWTLTVRQRETAEPPVVKAPTYHGIVDALVDRLDRDVLDATPARLHVHAAAVSRQGRAVVALGRSHAGKSTLATALLDHGFEYLTDEMLSIAGTGDALELSWVPKPISLRVDAATRFGLPIDDNHDEVVRGAHVVHLAPGRSGEGPAAAAAVQPGLLVSLARDDDQPPVFEAAHPADLTVALLEQSFDGSRLGADALHFAAGLAESSCCGRLRYGDTRDVAPVVRDALGAAPILPPRPADPSTDLPPVDVERATGPVRSSHTTSVWVDDRVVVLRVPSREVVAFDHAVSNLWGLLDGHAGLDDLADELAAHGDGDAEVIHHRLQETVADLARHRLVDVEPAP